jgi:hypothetical protein
MLLFDDAFKRYCLRLGLQPDQCDELRENIHLQGGMCWLMDLPLIVREIDGQYYVSEAEFNAVLDQLTTLGRLPLPLSDDGSDRSST